MSVLLNNVWEAVEQDFITRRNLLFDSCAYLTKWNSCKKYLSESTLQHTLSSTKFSMYCYFSFKGVLWVNHFWVPLLLIFFSMALKRSLDFKDSHGPLRIEIWVPSNFYTFWSVILNVMKRHWFVPCGRSNSNPTDRKFRYLLATVDNFWRRYSLNPEKDKRMTGLLRCSGLPF